MGKSVEQFITKHEKWQPGLEKLRALVSKTELEETIKWGQPVYTLDGKNVVGIGAFKSYFGLWFYNGALLDDPQGLLYNAQKGKTKALRQLRFSALEDLDTKVVQKFLQQAIQNQKAGKEVEIDISREAEIPSLLAKALANNKELKKQFYNLTPGRQREYAEYIREAKQQATKERRLQKIEPLILDGVGLNDHYK